MTDEEDRREGSRDLDAKLLFSHPHVFTARCSIRNRHPAVRTYEVPSCLQAMCTVLVAVALPYSEQMKILHIEQFRSVAIRIFRNFHGNPAVRWHRWEPQPKRVKPHLICTTTLRHNQPPPRKPNNWQIFNLGLPLT